MPRLALSRAVVQRAGQATQANPFDGGLELCQQLAQQFVNGLGVFFGAKEASLALMFLQVGHTQNQHSAIGIGKPTDRLQGFAHHLAADALVFARARFTHIDQHGHQ